jgi:hypothetical protein
MNRQLYILSVLLQAMSMIVLAGLAVYAWRHRRKTGVRSFFWIMIGALVHAGATIGMRFSRAEAMARFWYNFVFLAVAVLPVLFLMFVLRFAGKTRWLSRRWVVGLFILPLVTQIMVWTNSVHGLFMQSSRFVQTEFGMTYAGRPDGLWFRVHSAYSCLVVLVAIGVLIAMIVRPFTLYRPQAIGLLAGCLVPIAFTAAMSYLHIPEVLQAALPPVNFSLMGAISTWAIFRHQFLDVVPPFALLSLQVIPANLKALRTAIEG